MGAGTDPLAPIVRTANGAVRGIQVGGITEFRGVPFAAPPVGQLRWRAPEPAPRWERVRDATAFAPDPMQRMRAPRSRAPGIAEDCLYLNIWTPAEPGARRPVMVWLFGGGFVSGSASDAFTDGAVFARQGMVTVAVAYRVGIFGFLAHPGLVAESPHGTAGNYGALDAIAALRWVKANIAAFGGDPDNVTAFGVSAGSALLALLLTVPQAHGCFDRLILESPGSFRPLATLADAAAAGAALGDLAILRALPAGDVLKLEPRLVPAMRRLTAPRVLRPIHDGWLVPDDERAAFARGAFDAVPTIVGSNADEGSMMVAGWPVDDLAAWQAALDDNFGAMRSEAAALYPARTAEEARGAIGDMFGDTQFHLGTRELSRAIGARQEQTYRYLFARRRAGLDTGPHHGGEVPYVFGHLDVPFGPTAHDLPPADRDRDLSRAIQSAWIAFASTGWPGPVEGVDWPAARHGFLRIGDDVTVAHDWRERQLDFLNRHATSTPEDWSPT